MSNLKEQVQTILERFTLRNLFGAIVVFLICFLINKTLLRLTERVLQKSKLTEQIKKIILRVEKVGLWVLGGLIIAAELGFDTTSLIALISVLSLGITLAAEDILGNMAGGLVLASNRAFLPGDYIKTADAEGTVKDIHLAYTILQTVDGLTITVPNKSLSSGKIINYTTLGRRRIDIKVGASYDDDTKKVRSAMLELMNSFDTILKDPEPLVYLTSYDASTIEYTLYFWTKSADFLNTKREVTQKIRDVFDEKGIRMEYNHVNVHMLQG